MQSRAATVDEYLAELTPDRRATLAAVRECIRKNLPRGYEEGMQYGMIGYFVPHKRYPAGYHCDPRQPLGFVCLASQKNYMSLYMMCIYGDDEHAARFREAWAKTGKKLDMGKACIRFKRLDDLPLELIGQTVKRWPVKDYVAWYERAVRRHAERREVGAAATNEAAKKKQAPRKGAATRTKAPKTAPRRLAPRHA